VVGTGGDLRSSALAGLTVVAASQLVAEAWGLTGKERLLSLLVALVATALAIAVGQVLDEAKRQMLREQRAVERTGRRLGMAQHEREASERMAVLGRLASTMAHEINNPLAYTMANLRYVTEALEGERSPAVEELRLALKDSEEGLARIHAIVGRMSDFRLAAPSTPGFTDVRRALEAFVSGLELPAPSRARLVLEPGPALPAVALDPLRLGRVLRAVVTNALEAVEDQAQKRVTIAAERTGERLQVIVDDQGPGIDPSVLPHLFEPFVTGPGSTKLGLSLALARELVRSVGGELTASNRAEGGARVVVELPLAASG
jgi:C4-dicarboxylate-specific signal transduction histidine kinase